MKSKAMSRNRIIRDATLARQLKTEAKAKGIANRLSGILIRYWPEILTLIPEKPTVFWNPRPFAQSLDILRQVLQRQLAAELTHIGLWAGARASQSLQSAFHRHYDLPLRIAPTAQPVAFPAASFSLPAIAPPAPVFAPPAMPTLPQTGGLPPKPPVKTSVASGFPEPSGRFKVGGLIEPPSAFEIAMIVGPAPSKLTKLFDVDRVTGRVWSGISQGKNRVEIAKDLRVMLNNDRVTCRRVARTEGGRVATQVQLSVSEQLKDEVIGYQIHAVPKTLYSRPLHLLRSGTIYYRHPRPGQLGFDRMPQPPVEADGTIEFNCRCWLSPVWADEPAPIVDAYGNRPSLSAAQLAELAA